VQYAEFSGKIATLQNKLSRAKGYLEAQLEWHRQLAKETGEAAQIAAQGALEAEIKVAQLEDKLLAQIRFVSPSRHSTSFINLTGAYCRKRTVSGGVGLSQALPSGVVYI